VGLVAEFPSMFSFTHYPDPDPEKTFEKHQTLKLMTLTFHLQRPMAFLRPVTQSVRCFDNTPL
jgi:hypothetical protein